jgi:hypothetical protein
MISLSAVSRLSGTGALLTRPEARKNNFSAPASTNNRSIPS